MRGKKNAQPSMIILASPSQMVPPEHPLRGIKRLADAALRELEQDFDAMYAQSGRCSVPPERLLKSMLLMAFYSVRSERQLCEQLAYNMLFRWFVDLDMTEPVFDHSTFSKNRDRLLDHDIAGKFFRTIVEQARLGGLMSTDHFSVDGTLIEAWASHRSLRPKDEDPGDGDSNGWSDFSGKSRSNDTHESKTDPESRLARKGHGREAKLSFSVHALIENKNGLVNDITTGLATGTAEREHALAMVDRCLGGTKRITLAADKAYDTRDFVDRCRERNVTPHVAQNTAGGRRRSAIDGRTARHSGYRVSLVLRRAVERVFGWMKGPGGLKRTRVRGVQRTNLLVVLTASAYNLLRMNRLAAAQV